jgi:hypothetical protein
LGVIEWALPITVYVGEWRASAILFGLIQHPDCPQFSLVILEEGHPFTFRFHEAISLSSSSRQ